MYTLLIVYIFNCAHSHLDIQLNDTIIVASVILLDAYTKTDTKNGQYG